MRASPAVIAERARTCIFALGRRALLGFLMGASAAAFAQGEESVSDDLVDRQEVVAQSPREWPSIEITHRSTELAVDHVAGDESAAAATVASTAEAVSTPTLPESETGDPELSVTPSPELAEQAETSETLLETAPETIPQTAPLLAESSHSDENSFESSDESSDESSAESAPFVESTEEDPVAQAVPRIVGGEVEVPPLPKARNIDLTEPVTGELQSEVEVLPGVADGEVDLGSAEELVLLGARVEPGTTTRLSWSPHDAFEGISVPTPVLVVNGAKPGPVLCLTGAVHGDELNGIEVIRRVMYDLNASQVAGTVIGVPIVNQLGFRRNSRYLPDRRDLNRYFPGTPDGSSAARIAYSFFQDIVVNCDMLVDLHTGSFHRTNLPQLRADLNNPAVAEFARAFGDMVVLHGEGQPGTLRREAVEIGIPAITVEAGEPMRIQEDAVADGVKGIRTLMTSLGMSSRPFFWSRPRPAYYHSYWVRAARGGLLMSSVQLGAQVREGEVLGVVINPITNEQSDVVAPFGGKVIGMALNQVVMPGFAAYHVGVQASEAEMREAAEQTTSSATSETLPDPQELQASDEALGRDIEPSEPTHDGMSDAPEHREE